MGHRINLQQILDKCPKAKKSFERFFRTGFKSDMPQTKWEGFLANFYSVNHNSQIGWLLAWMRSKGYKSFVALESEESVMHMAISGWSVTEIPITDKDFNTGFLSLTKEFCKQIEKT